jgi:hypothetical protein
VKLNLKLWCFSGRKGPNCHVNMFVSNKMATATHITIPIKISRNGVSLLLDGNCLLYYSRHLPLAHRLKW